ncbi:hypothetical protein [Curtobacterium sp. MCPF17_031]|uniref:hypothetical protein n=1 Tax=Curtobacterium sp. MCPF17_031 TaxID=2175653 RepID=UPI000DA8A1B5|nr:hypothetical protein [Curtobacterium sp. MCPF17_031]PZE38310.1 hypothetical protein DEJ31_03065 [Curtobacterium sp. MCPF17_031]
MENDPRNSAPNGSDPTDARQALAAVDATRASVADRLVTPWWYHLALGLLAGAYLVGYALGDTVVRAAVLVVFFAGILALVSAYRRLTGVWVSGHRAGAATRWAVAMGVFDVVAVVAAIFVHEATGLLWPVWVLAVMVVVAMVVLGRRFDRRLRSELRQGRVQAS